MEMTPMEIMPWEMTPMEIMPWAETPTATKPWAPIPMENSFLFLREVTGGCVEVLSITGQCVNNPLMIDMQD